MCAQNAYVKSPKKPSKKAPKRIRKPTNVTLDAALKAEAKRYAKEDEATDLSGLVNQLLIERLKAANRWPPKSKEGAA